MYRTHKIQLDPTNKQETQLMKAAGAARFAYNWALHRWGEQYREFKAGKRDAGPSWCSLNKELNAIKREQFPWMLEVTKCAPEVAIMNLGKAFNNFFAKRDRYPRFKKRGQHDAFKASVGLFSVKGDYIRLPRIGWVHTHEPSRFPNAKLVSVTVSRTADRWYAAITVEVESTANPAPEHIIGVDVGVNTYVTSDRVYYTVPRSYRKAERKLRRAQQGLSRKQKGSMNRRKAVTRVARIHAHTANIRQDWLHKLTTELANSANVVAIEDLNVKGMLGLRSLSKSINDAAFGEFRRQLEYKIQDRGSNLVVVDRFYPSSKICSACGTKAKSLPLSVRAWVCASCGAHHDRDLNAAINLARTAGGSSVAACGDTVRPSVLGAGVREAGTRQPTMA